MQMCQCPVLETNNESSEVVGIIKPGRRVKLNSSQAVNVHKLLTIRYLRPRAITLNCIVRSYLSCHHSVGPVRHRLTISRNRHAEMPINLEGGFGLSLLTSMKCPFNMPQVHEKCAVALSRYRLKC